MMRPIVLVELNEVHWPVLDAMRVSRPALDELLRRARTHTTHADAGALQPWITWPTLHRGLAPDAHGVRQLAQDPATRRGTAIWEDVRARGGSIGIVGSLHSWPPIDPGPGGFVVPDSFAPDAACVPAELAPLQAWSQQLSRESGRVASRRVPMRATIDALPAAFRLHLSPRLAVRALRQLVRERIHRESRDARPIVQAALFWSVFRKLYARGSIAFASFFTNHVASVLHRHYADAFPSELAGHVVSTSGRRTAEHAFDLVEEMARDLLRLLRARPELIVVIASSMGQGAAGRAHHGRELAIVDIARLLEALGIDRATHVPGLAMVPQATTRVLDMPLAERIRDGAHALRTASGWRVLDVVARGDSVSITVGTPSHDDVSAGWLARGPERLDFETLGIAVHDVAAGTGAHVSEGALAIVGRDVVTDTTRSELPLTSVKSLLLAQMDRA